METDAAPAPRTAIVTGASAGLGSAIARALGALGWRVVLAARRVDRLEDCARGVAAAGGEPLVVGLDVADPGSVEACFARVDDAFGAADVLVNNAGSSHPGRIQTLEVDDIRQEVAVNLTGPILMTRAFVARLVAAHGTGDVVFITSDAAVHARPQQAIYTATKAGLEGLSRALSLELEGTGIRSTIVRPGPARSEYAASWDPEKIRELLPYWRHFGLQRHAGVMPADAVARAVVLAVTTPRGVHFNTLEVQPEAPSEA